MISSHFSRALPQNYLTIYTPMKNRESGFHYISLFWYFCFVCFVLNLVCEQHFTMPSHRIFFIEYKSIRFFSHTDKSIIFQILLPLPSQLKPFCRIAQWDLPKHLNKQLKIHNLNNKNNNNSQQLLYISGNALKFFLQQDIRYINFSY